MTDETAAVALEYRIAALEREVDLTITERVAFLEKKLDMVSETARRDFSNADSYTVALTGQRWDAHNAVHIADRDAREKASEAMEKRLMQMNEFRAQISDMTRTFATREMVESITGAIAARIDREATDTRARFERGDQLMRAEVRPVQDARVGQSALVAALVVAVSVVSVIIVLANFLSVHGK